jgi:transcriptional regulator with XRE-family HTH domain
MGLGDRLQKLREAKGLKPIDVASSAKIGLSEYQRYETGGAEPKTPILESIASALGTTVGELRKQSTLPKSWVIAEGPPTKDSEGRGYTPRIAVVAPDLESVRRLASEVWPALPKFKRVDPPREMT